MLGRSLILTAIWVMPNLALGAEVTHVATAATDLWPVEIDLSAGFVGSIETADIAREQFQTNSQGISNLALVNQLIYRRTTTSVPLRRAPVGAASRRGVELGRVKLAVHRGTARSWGRIERPLRLVYRSCGKTLNCS